MSRLFSENVILSSRSSLMHVPSFLDLETADSLMERINSQITFARPTIAMFGKQSLLPREVAWIADNDLRYGYSGICTHPVHWPRFLHPIRQLVEAWAETTFNSVLVNRYRDGDDAVAWHSDNEPELGTAPIVASVSLGATRQFVLRSKQDQTKHQFELSHGDLLIMLGACQTEFEHSIPRTKRVAKPRINLTFRHVLARIRASEPSSNTTPNETGGIDEGRR